MSSSLKPELRQPSQSFRQVSPQAKSTIESPPGCDRPVMTPIAMSEPLFMVAFAMVERLYSAPSMKAIRVSDRTALRSPSGKVRCTAPALHAHCRCIGCAQQKTP
ncbi:hypothetical protein BOSEA31B_20577 [Hyphomicrobiales bacterium]|nr:hypothetical protein BOSEA31B_20577 [Hyphomicrobiales bacterium]CAH1702932.1 hypothetical protein BOSEA1005_30804 [Hyphomicrobiales bacterium]CAI0347117.1 hypothetical protein BO1005MUT1_530293 [Hyphomicrobiales bacterium]